MTQLLAENVDMSHAQAKYTKFKLKETTLITQNIEIFETKKMLKSLICTLNWWKQKEVFSSSCISGKLHPVTFSNKIPLTLKKRIKCTLLYLAVDCGNYIMWYM